MLAAELGLPGLQRKAEALGRGAGWAGRRWAGPCVPSSFSALPPAGLAAGEAEPFARAMERLQACLDSKKIWGLIHV